MAARRHPVVVATRVTRTERALIDACAEMEGVNVTLLIRNILMPAIGRRLTRDRAGVGAAA